MVVPITLGGYDQVIDVLLDKLKSAEHFVHFLLKMSEELQTPIGRRLYLYFIQGRIIVHRLLTYSLIHIL